MASCFVCRGRGHIKLHDGSPSIPCVACGGQGTLREVVATVPLRITVDRVTVEGNRVLDYSIYYDDAVCFRGTVKDGQACTDVRIPARTLGLLNKMIVLEWRQWSEPQQAAEGPQSAALTNLTGTARPSSHVSAGRR